MFGGNIGKRRWHPAPPTSRIKPFVFGQSNHWFGPRNHSLVRDTASVHRKSEASHLQVKPLLSQESRQAEPGTLTAVSAPSSQRFQAHRGNDRRTHRGAPLLFRQGDAAALPGDRSGLSETTSAIAFDFERTSFYSTHFKRTLNRSFARTPAGGVLKRINPRPKHKLTRKIRASIGFLPCG